MPLSRVYHVRQLNQGTISEFIRMIAGLRCVLRTSSDEDSSIIGLNRAETNWNIEVNIQNFSLLSLMINIVECHNLLIKFEEVDFVCSDFFNLVLILLCCRSI